MFAELKAMLIEQGHWGYGHFMRRTQARFFIALCGLFYGNWGALDSASNVWTSSKTYVTAALIIYLDYIMMLEIVWVCGGPS